MIMVRAAFDMSSVPHALGGVARYLTSLGQALRAVAGEYGVEAVLIDVPAAHPGIQGPSADCVSVRTPLYMKVPLLRRIPIRGGWEPSSRSIRIGKAAGWPRVYHHSGVQPLRPESSESVVTVYDLSALDHPSWHTPHTVSYAERERQMLMTGSWAAAISEWTAGLLADRLGMPEERVQVIGGAADDIFSPGEPSPEVLREYGLFPAGYLLHVGNYVPRKNIPFLIDVYREAWKDAVQLPLILVGAGGWGDVPIEEGGGVRMLSNVPDRHLVHLYRGCRALLCPSEYEGLGLPVLEAMACGAPVISSDCTALSETVGGNGALIPPGDFDAWLEQLVSIKDESRMNALRQMSSSSQRKRWKDVAADLCTFYRRIAGE
jgi:glycosyltransferase involved in cell wall biosynthesis